jgi:hypothetical protein
MKRTTIAIIIVSALAGCAGPAAVDRADPDWQACDYDARKAAAGTINPIDRGFTIGQLRAQCLKMRGR